MAWIGAAIAGGAALIGGISSANSQKSASKAAVRMYEQGRDRVYGGNLATTYAPGGASAYNYVLSLLGVPGAGSSWGQGTPDYEAYVKNNPDLLSAYQANSWRPGEGKSMADFGKEHYTRHGEREGRELSMVGGAQGGPGQGNGYQNFLDSSGYRTQLQSGIEALDASASSRGMRNSGATQKAAVRFGQGLGAQYFNNYIGQLMNTVNTGLAADQTLAGVATGTAQNAGGAMMNSGAGTVGNAIATAGGIAGYGVNQYNEANRQPQQQPTGSQTTWGGG